MSTYDLSEATDLSETDTAQLTPAALRLSHALHFAEQYFRHNGPPRDSDWLMVGYFDAFLFALASVGEMADDKELAQLNQSGVFRFFRALRNITAHHSVLAASVGGNKFLRPLNRVMIASIGGGEESSRFKLDFARLRAVLDAVGLERKSEQKNIEAALGFIGQLEGRRADVYLEDLMREAMQDANATLGKPLR